MRIILRPGMRSVLLPVPRLVLFPRLRHPAPVYSGLPRLLPLVPIKPSVLPAPEILLMREVLPCSVRLPLRRERPIPVRRPEKMIREDPDRGGRTEHGCRELISDRSSRGPYRPEITDVFS